MSDDNISQPKDPEDSDSGSVDYVIGHWNRLPPHIREAIVNLVDAAMVTTPNNRRIHSHEDDEG